MTDLKVQKIQSNKLSLEEIPPQEKNRERDTLFSSTTEVSSYNDVNSPAIPSPSGVDPAGMSRYCSVEPEGSGGATPPPATLIPADQHPGVTRVITSINISYDDGRFNGTIEGYMVIPDLEGAIDLFTGHNVSAFERLPKIEDVQFSGNRDGGTLTYFFRTDNIGPLKVRDFGYNIQTSVTRSNGVVTVSWTNASSSQPTHHGDDGEVTSFNSNIGSWSLIPEPGYDPPVYRVTWNAVTEINQASLQFGSWIASDGEIEDNAQGDCRANFVHAAQLIQAM